MVPRHRDRLRGERSQGRGTIFRRQVPCHLKREIHSVKRLRRRLCEVLIRQQMRDDALVHAPLGGERAALVHRLARVLQKPIIDRRVAGPCIEGDELSTAPHERHVRNATDIQHRNRCTVRG
jgi:hypothetical protein